jgi:PAS domain S-box-containing protein
MESMGELLSALLEHAQDIIIVLDDDGTISFVNPAIDRTLGYEPEEMVGTDAFQYVHPDDREDTVELFTQLVEEPDRTTDRVTHRIQHADGHWKWFESIGSNRADTDLEGYVVNSRQITERKRYEQRLERQRDNLDLLNQMLRHDIRNDLQLVTAYGATLSDHVEDPSAREDLDGLLASTNHAVELTETAGDIAEVVRASEADRKRVGLRRCLETELEELREAYPAASVSVDGEIPAVAVWADAMLDSVFRNLLRNAVQHNDGPSTEVVVSATERDDVVAVRVADDGPGVPEDRRESLFGRGETGVRSPRNGFGLYLVGRLVETYGGDVRVEDAQLGGAAFVVELPMADRPATRGA